MNPLRPLRPNVATTPPVRVAGPVSQPAGPSHPGLFTMAVISENSMLGLAQMLCQPDGHQQLYATLAREGMVDGTLTLQRAEGNVAQYAQLVNLPLNEGVATLQVGVQLNEQARYDVKNISLLVHNTGASETMHLSAGAPPVIVPSKSRVPDPERPGETLLASSLRHRERGRELIADPANPGEMSSRQAVYNQTQVPDPRHAGSTAGRKQVNQHNYITRRLDDPLNPGQTISRSAAQKRQMIEDPNNPGQMISRGQHENSKLVEDDENPGKMVSLNTLRSRRYYRQLVDDPRNPGQQISRGALKQRKN